MTPTANTSLRGRLVASQNARPESRPSGELSSGRLARLRRTLATPGRARSVLLRRALAAAFLIAAVFSVAHGARENPQVAVFARDVAAGEVLEDSDIEWRRVPASLIPATAVAPGEQAGAVALTAATAGEIVTTTRLLSPELTSLSLPGGAVGENIYQAESGPWHMVPLRLAEPEVAGLLHHGDTVSVVTAREDTTGLEDPAAAEEAGEAAGARTPEVIATGGRVITTSLSTADAGGGRPGTILLALQDEAAAAVAAASLSLPLTVIITGPRASAAADT